ncbi:MAG: hypothetical protein K0B09_00410 [Bacteroidales bacterium]|nr:hypothetical protein [Bacteroidales bacterium]
MARTVFTIFIVFLLGVLIGIPAFMRISWQMAEKKPMEVFILDKTVLNKNYQEHLSFNWVLKNQKYVKSDEDFYLPERDYYGFFPDGMGNYVINDIEDKTTEDLARLADNYDMAYYTDLYGVYWIEWHNEYPHVKPEQEPGLMGERSEWIYGGLTKNELAFIRLMKSRNKLIINEFNIIGSPTSFGIRKEYEEEFDITWKNWTGRYFSTLDTTKSEEIPHWLVRNYMKQNNNEWPFTKSGIAFVRNDDMIVVLENETHLNIEVPYIYSDEKLVDHYGVVKKIKYPYWFDICTSGDSNEVLAEYMIEANLEGDSILDHWNIPTVFPAVIKNKHNNLYFYFAGDFADNPISLKNARLKHIEKLDYLMYDRVAQERRSFFRLFYRPMVTKILDDYYQNLKAVNQ